MIVWWAGIARAVDVSGGWRLTAEGSFPVGLELVDRVGVPTEAVAYDVDLTAICDDDRGDHVCVVGDVAVSLRGRRPEHDDALRALVDGALAAFPGREVRLVRAGDGAVRVVRWEEPASPLTLNGHRNDLAMGSVLERALAPLDLVVDDGSGARAWMSRRERSVLVPPVFDRLGVVEVRHVATPLGDGERVETRATARWSDPEASTTGCDVVVVGVAVVEPAADGEPVLLRRTLTLDGVLDRPMEPGVPFVQSARAERQPKRTE